jgi:flagellar hook-associated protein 1 FlgK
VVQGDDGLTITTADGTALVVGGKSYALDAALDADGHQRVMSEGRDITAEFSGGKLGALLSVRDDDTAIALHDLDQVAFALATAVNEAHAAGFDLSGTKGGNFFTVAASADGSASTIKLAVTEPGEIAASSNGDAGSNGNLGVIGAVRTAGLLNGQSAIDVLAALSFRVGSSTADSQAQLEASESIQSQLEKQRDAISGVSLDEEAANLMRFQRAYQAAGRVISAADQMLDIACNLGKE